MPQIFHRSTNTLSRATIFGAVFVVAACSLFVLFVANLLLLKESSSEIGEAETKASPDSLFAGRGESVRQYGEGYGAPTRQCDRLF